MAWSLLEAVGSDRYLSLEECPEATSPWAQETWQIYESGFGAYCESRMDPMFHRLEHPATLVGRLLTSAAPVLVVGTGPSLAASAGDLRRLRSRVRVATSPRGAQALRDLDIVPDLVFVEHRTALDAHHSARVWRDGHAHALKAVPLVAADWRTPSDLIEGLGSRLFVPDSLPTWGAWPATLAAMALRAGASRVGLLGVDLGTTAAPDAAYTPVARLLELIAKWSTVPTLDCGAVGARKAGWPSSPLEQLATAGPLPSLAAETRRAPSRESRRTAARSMLSRAEDYVDRARSVLDEAARGKSGFGRPPVLQAAAAEMLAWKDNRTLRIDLQEGLGLSFLPRLWRSGISPHLDSALWRPLVLASHELVRQAEALEAELGS
jgi:hypothetical protein